MAGGGERAKRDVALFNETLEGLHRVVKKRRAFLAQ
jgi:hypothetical protein